MNTALNQYIDKVRVHGFLSKTYVVSAWRDKKWKKNSLSWFWLLITTSCNPVVTKDVKVKRRCPSQFKKKMLNVYPKINGVLLLHSPRCRHLLCLAISKIFIAITAILCSNTKPFCSICVYQFTCDFLLISSFTQSFVLIWTKPPLAYSNPK